MEGIKIMSYKRKAEDNRRLRKLHQKTANSFLSGVYFDEQKGRLVRFSASRKKALPRYLKRRSNKSVRRTHGRMHHGEYRKQYDYWWNLW